MLVKQRIPFGFESKDAAVSRKADMSTCSRTRVEIRALAPEEGIRLGRVVDGIVYISVVNLELRFEGREFIFV